MGQPIQKAFKMTPQRLAVLECLKGNRSHPSAEDIFREVREKYPTMSFATVYNILQALQERGDIQRLTFDPERLRFDPCTTYHHHFICMECNGVIDVQVDSRPRISDEQKAGFEVIRNHIEFYGVCPDCSKVKRKRHAKKDTSH
jgi:Fur family peroxide stress response transcriptional regulator